MSNEKQHSPQHDALLKKKALEQNEVGEVLVVIKKYGVPVLVAVIVCCGIIMAKNLYTRSKLNKELNASTAMAIARTAEDFGKIVEKYGSTTSAPLAMMSQARTQFADGNFAAAQETYEAFLKKYPENEMVLQAKLNVITCREEKGELSEAHLLYSDFVLNNKDSYLAPVAMMGQARCLAELGLVDDARRAYEDLIMSYPGSAWASAADTRIKVIKSKIQ